MVTILGWVEDDTGMGATVKNWRTRESYVKGNKVYFEYGICFIIRMVRDAAAFTGAAVLYFLIRKRGVCQI